MLVAREKKTLSVIKTVFLCISLSKTAKKQMKGDWGFICLFNSFTLRKSRKQYCLPKFYAVITRGKQHKLAHRTNDFNFMHASR